MATPTLPVPDADASEPSSVPPIRVSVTITLAVDSEKWIAGGYGTEADTFTSLRRKIQADLVNMINVSPQAVDGAYRVDGYR